MANNYLQFSEVLDKLTKKQEAWLQQQLEPIIVVNGKEFLEDEAPDCDEPDYQGLRFLRDYGNLDDDADMRGFDMDFQGTGRGRHAWIYAEDGGDPGRVSHLVRKFLKRFRPDQCWSLTYATTCSKLRIGEFGGGAVFVTADEIRWNNSNDFVEDCTRSFQRRRDVTRLVEKAKTLRIACEDLDDAVLDAASAPASESNNGGLAEQIARLVEQLGTEETETVLDGLRKSESSEKPDEDEYLTDASGRRLRRNDVEDLAAENVCASGEGTPGAALDAYIESMNDVCLLQWATDENGNFPDHLVAEKTQRLDDVVTGLDSAERADLSEQLRKFSPPPEAEDKG